VIDIQVRGESGDVIARATCGLQWTEELAGLDSATYPMLCGLLPYADAMFNHRQTEMLLREVDRLPAGSVLDNVQRAEIRRLCETVDDGSHRYLWFVGD